MNMRSCIALFWMTNALIVRLVRQGTILRSITFPVLLTVGTLLITLGVVSLTRSPPIIALSPEFSTNELRSELKAVGLTSLVIDHPEQEVHAGRVAGATNGTTFWATGETRAAVAGESVVREYLDAPWKHDVPPLASAIEASAFGTLSVRFLCAIFALYGVVFGAAMVARDQQDGTLEVACTLPISDWVHGASRLLAAVLVLTTALWFSAIALTALMSIENLGAWQRHGLAACMGATSLGLISVGGARLNSGFSSALALGLSLTAGLMSLGYVFPKIGALLPLSSIIAEGNGWAPVASATLLAGLAVSLFSYRSLRT